MKNSIYKSILKNKLGLTDKKIYARNCVIKLVKDSESKNFLNSNHNQQSDNFCRRIQKLSRFFL